MSKEMPQNDKRQRNSYGEQGRRPAFPGKSQLFTLILVLYDIAAVNGSYFAALWLRFDLRFSMIPEEFLGPFLKFTPFYTVVCLLFFNYFKLYRSVWRFASYNELMRVFAGSAASAVFHTLAITAFFGRMPISYYVFGAMIQFGAMVFVRFSYRFILLEREVRSAARSQKPVDNIMLIGAGNAGQMILRDIRMARETAGRVLCIIDDDPNKWKRYIDGVQIIGGREEILGSAEKYKIDKIYVAVPLFLGEPVVGVAHLGAGLLEQQVAEKRRVVLR